MTEKIWSTAANFAVATTSSYLVMGQNVLLQLKNKMVSEAGWTVIGSSDGTQYEWAGDAAFPTVPDMSVNSNDGTATNMAFTALDGNNTPGGVASRSFLLDGVDEYVLLGNVLGFTKADAFSISCWFRTTTTSVDILVSKYFTNEGNNNGYALMIQADGTLKGALFGGLFSGGSIEVSTTAAYNDDAWHHVLLTYTGSESALGLKLVVDGEFVPLSIDEDDLTGIITTSVDLAIGSRQGVAGGSFDGRIAEVGIYDAALTKTQAEAIFNEGVPNDLTELDSRDNLVGWWRAGSPGTSGGTYGGDSTGAYDVWEAAADVVRALDGGNPGWCVLQSPTTPSGTFYATLAMEGPFDTDNNGYFAFADRRPDRHPWGALIYLPQQAFEAKYHGFIRETFFLMYAGTYTGRGYFSGAPDGSFVYTMNLTDRAYFTGLIMFHVLDPYSVGDNPMPTCSYVHVADGGWTYGIYADSFRGYHQRPELDPNSLYDIVSFRSCYPIYDGSTRLFSTMSTTDFESKVEGFPTYLIASDGTTTAGRQAILGRIPDMFAAPEGLTDGDSMPVTSPEWFVFGDWILPGGPPPALGP